MDLITLVITLVIIGVVLYCINTLIPMDGKIKQILNIVVVIVVLLWVLSLFSGYFPNPRIGR